MRKRMATIFLVLALLLSQMACPVTAATNSSAYIAVVSIGLYEGDNVGEVELNYSITGMGVMSTIGIFKIEVYKSNGTKYDTIYGSSSNGLLVHNTSGTAGTYTISCVAGNTYYCAVTVYAGTSSGSDLKTYTTGTATAKPFAP